MVRGPRRQHRAGRHLVPGAGGHRWHDHAQLRRHQRRRSHPRRQRHHFLLRPADRLPRREMRHRYRSSDARRRLRLHRLNDYLADLRILHVYFLCDRSGDPRNRAGDVLRNPAPARLPHQRRCHHSAGHPRHHADQPLSAVDAAAVDRASHHALRGDRLRQSALLCGVDQICRRAWQPCGSSRSAAVRHCRLGRVFPGGADRRAGRLSALPSARPANLENVVVDRVVKRRARLDHSRRAEAVGRIVPGLLCAQPRRHLRTCC